MSRTVYQHRQRVLAGGESQVLAEPSNSRGTSTPWQAGTATTMTTKKAMKKKEQARTKTARESAYLKYTSSDYKTCFQLHFWVTSSAAAIQRRKVAPQPKRETRTSLSMEQTSMHGDSWKTCEKFWTEFKFWN